MSNETNQELETTESSEQKIVKVQIGNNERTYEFKHAIIHGVENKEDGRLLSLICGYSNVNDFSLVFANFIVECYYFLKDNYDEEEVDVMKAFKEYIGNILEGIENGDFDEGQLESIKEEIK